ncbi:zinc ribbon domain-containing protein [Rhodanobacter denitrificans]|uniref:Putative zinc-ribbon domain-containing protein n=1 Tax=Rhodanobacter denitrificans TaxID=666685 RepID=M4NIK9_9GAMM|nr:zinc ribbon domain-containing protein [Rhodanobacter denitrificans]AGG89932.1 hypothetical protein R2APBS1_2855 [Rhodanobacter denitrificans]UJM85327.1 zinc ribbon domain-containing protein [Rhodanobacter denitrificans]
MALINCPDCKHSVSDTAPACPNCGRPIAPVQVEQTSKSYKGGMLIGFIVAVGGFFSAAAIGGAAGLTIVVIGLLLFVGSAIGGWWHHG